jgi:hypothetical protein
MAKTQLADLPVDPDFGGWDKAWREHAPPADADNDDDEDLPCPADVAMVLGFDPDDKWPEKTPEK